MRVIDLRQLMCEIAQKNGIDYIYQRAKATDTIEPIRIAFLGQFTTGKSTLINALLKEKQLPMYDTPTNAAIVEITKADDNKIEVVRTVNGEEITTNIQPYALAKEVMTAEEGKIIRIFRNDLDFLSGDMIIVDTPGVHSMHDIHTDVTCGYLPFIDAAVISISALGGDVTASLLEFIKNQIDIIEGLKDRLFFCVTMLDRFLESEREQVYDQIKSTLSTVVPSALILMISPNVILDHALQNRTEEYDRSSIMSLINFIQTDIPKRNIEIREMKQCRVLKEIKQLLINDLKDKIASLDYSFPELDAQINATEEMIKELEKNRSKLNDDFDQIKSSITQQIYDEIDGLIDIIAFKVSKEMEYKDDIDTFAGNVRETILDGLSKLKLPEGRGFNNLGGLINARVSTMIEGIMIITNFIADAITIALLAILIPGKTALDAAGAGAVATQKAATIAKTGTEVVKTSIFIKLLGGLGKIIKEINPIEKLKVTLTNPILKAKIERKMRSEMNKLLQSMFHTILKELDDYIELNYNNPLKQQLATLNTIRKMKESKITNLDSIKNDIREEIRSLSINDC